MRRHTSKSDRKLGILANRRLERLSTTVQDLFGQATENEKILRRYQQYELKLLDVASFESLLDMLVRNSVEYFQLDSVELWLYDPQLTLTQLLPDEYTSVSELRLLNVADELTALYGSEPTVRLLSVGSDKTLPVFKGLSLYSAALLPLVRHGVIVGSLHFGSKVHHRFTGDKSTDFITHLASIVSVCLENAVNQDRLHRLSMYDMLTQVKNRRAFHLALDEEVSRAARSADPLSLLFVDLDYFKRVNDRYGHPMGDRVLKEIAQYINNMLRKTDHVCRYGGEEFSLLLPNCGRQRALDIAERIRQQISELLITDDKGVSVNVTLSIGVSGWFCVDSINEVSRDAEKKVAVALIACSDKGVYLAKAEGRNCIRYVEMDSVRLSEECEELNNKNTGTGNAINGDTELMDNGRVGFGSGCVGIECQDSEKIDLRRNDVWPEMIL